MPTQEPEAFRGIASAVTDASVEYKRITEEQGSYSVREFIRLSNFAGSAGQLWSRLVAERAARPKEFVLTVPSMPNGGLVLCFI